MFSIAECQLDLLRLLSRMNHAKALGGGGRVTAGIAMTDAVANVGDWLLRHHAR